MSTHGDAVRRGQRAMHKSPERWLVAQARRDAGETLDAIALDMGVSRERVRQKTSRRLGRIARIDPLALMRELRKPTTLRFWHVSKALGFKTNPLAVVRCARELGVYDAAERLMCWRRRAKARQRVRRAIAELIAKNGCKPTTTEIARALGYNDAYGSIQALAYACTGSRSLVKLWASVGFTPYRSGRAGARDHRIALAEVECENCGCHGHDGDVCETCGCDLTYDSAVDRCDSTDGAAARPHTTS